MKKKWIVIPSLLVLTVIGALAATPIGRPLLDRVLPQPTVVVDRAMQVEAVDTLMARLNDYYVFPDKAKQIEAVLRQRQQEGEYDGMTDGKQLARQLTDDLRGVAHDLHMSVHFSPRAIPREDEVGPPPASQAEWEQRTNFAMRLIMRRMASSRVEEVERLPSNIGYLKLSGFPPDFLMAEKYGEAMDQLAGTDGLIVDLRDNRGGDPKSVALLVSYFVDQRTRLNDIWDRETGISTQHWTQEKLDGKRYGGTKPVLILAGPGTMSAGEDFAYTMQSLKRATVIGEPTWGGAHPTRPSRLGAHFLAMIPSRRTISPITGSNWEGVGVKPDIKAAPDEALAVAKDLMQRRIQGGSSVAVAGH